MASSEWLDFDYHNSDERGRRLVANRDHCGSQGATYALKNLVSGGRVFDPHKPAAPLTSAPLRTPSGGGMYIYAVSPQLVMQIALDSIRGTPDATKHETLFHNANVVAAGEIQFVDGVVCAINDLSGSYGTETFLTLPPFAEAILRSVRFAGVQLDSALEMRLEAICGSSP